MSDRRVERIRRFIEKSEEALDAAEANADWGHWSTVGNRLYYACFYAVKALLIQNGFEADTHSGVKTLFGKHFVQSGPVGREEARFYSDLFKKRLKIDYDEFFDPDPEQLRDWLPAAKRFIDTIRTLLDEPAA